MKNWMARQVAVLRSGKSGRGLPQSKTWRRLERHGWRVSVLECASPLALFLLLPTAAAQSTNDAPPLLPALSEIPPTLWEQHGVLIVMLGILLVAMLSAAIWRLFQPKPTVPLPIEIQTRNELELLQIPTEDGKTVSRISQVLKHYFAVAFELPAGEMTTAEFSRAITANKKVGSELAASVSEFLRQCDERKFSPFARVQTSVCSRALELVEVGESRCAELRQVAQPK
jgi:hypothetical protein